jgi:predicted component of type VI protein secretion system
MANSESPIGLQAEDFTDQRNDALREGVKGLFLMNGGGAVAMLAFLQAIWEDNPQLAKYVVASIALLAAGVFLAGLVQFFRYNASFSFQGDKHCAFKVYRFLYLTAAYCSLVAFLVGVLIMVSGAWCSLPTKPVY